MDLHDYKDVAENYDRYLDVMYAEDDHHANFREFYLRLAQEYGEGGVIDVACGTGAVLLYLAEHGIYTDGTDISEAMCDVAGRKAASMGLKLNIYPADMTEFCSGRQYSLAIIARSGFMHLTTQDLQIQALENLRKQLLPGGILTLNTFDPWPPMQAQQMRTGPEDWTYRLEYVNRDGNREIIYNAIGYDPCTQIMSGNWKFEEYDGSGNIRDVRVRPLKMRQTYRSEMFLLAKLCGFTVMDIFRGYDGDREDLNDPSSAALYNSNLIWILRKTDGD